jgi:hypothetical protein
MTESDLHSIEKMPESRKTQKVAIAQSRRLESLVRAMSGERVLSDRDVRKLLGECTKGIDLQPSPSLAGFFSR